MLLPIIAVIVIFVGCTGNEATQADDIPVVITTYEAETNEPTYEPAPTPPPMSTEPEPELEEDNAPDIYVQVLDFLRAIDEGIYVIDNIKTEINAYDISLDGSLARRREPHLPRYYSGPGFTEPLPLLEDGVLYVMVSPLMSPNIIFFDVVNLFPQSNALYIEDIAAMMDINFEPDNVIVATVHEDVINTLVQKASIEEYYSPLTFTGHCLVFRFHLDSDGALDSVTILLNMNIWQDVSGMCENELAYWVEGWQFTPIYMDFEKTIQLEISPA